MKKHNLLAIPALTFIFLFVASCGNKISETNTPATTETENDPFVIRLGSDTINYTDANGHKHGLWLVGKDSFIYKNDIPYPVTYLNIEEVINKLNKN